MENIKLPKKYKECYIKRFESIKSAGILNEVDPICTVYFKKKCGKCPFAKMGGAFAGCWMWLKEVLGKEPRDWHVRPGLRSIECRGTEEEIQMECKRILAALEEMEWV